MSPLMHLKVLLPFQVFADRFDVARIVAHSSAGSIGLLPQRQDCVMALVPGVLGYVTGAGETVYLAVDQGVLVKTGSEVLVSVRNAIGGADLGNLHLAVQRDFLNLDAEEKERRASIAKLENALVRGLAEFPHAG